LCLGATAQVQFFGIYFNALRNGQRAAAATAAAAAAEHASSGSSRHALLPHARMLY